MVKDLNNSDLENVCRELAGAFPGILSWQWGDGRTISIRFGPAYRKLSDPQKAAHVKQFRGWFGI
jgi:hypothetical protein